MDKNTGVQLVELKKWLVKHWGEPEISIEETAEEKAMGDHELKKASKRFAKENFQGKKFINNDTGREIIVSRDGLDKWDYMTKSREQSISIKKLNIYLNK